MEEPFPLYNIDYLEKNEYTNDLSDNLSEKNEYDTNDLSDNDSNGIINLYSNNSYDINGINLGDNDSSEGEERESCNDEDEDHHSFENQLSNGNSETIISKRDPNYSIHCIVYKLE